MPRLSYLLGMALRIFRSAKSKASLSNRFSSFRLKMHLTSTSSSRAESRSN